MEIVLVVLAVWVGVSLILAALVGRFLRVADRRERATVVTRDGMPLPTSSTVMRSDAAEVHETA